MVASAADGRRIARREWGIENGLHDRRNVTIQEDARQLRRGQGPHANAARNNTVISVVLSSGATNFAAAQRQFAYAIDRAFARVTAANGRT